MKILKINGINGKLMELIEISWKYWKTPDIEAAMTKIANVTPFWPRPAGYPVPFITSARDGSNFPGEKMSALLLSLHSTVGQYLLEYHYLCTKWLILFPTIVKMTNDIINEMGSQNLMFL